MKKLVDIKSLYQYTKNETSEDLENFDMIYYGVIDEEYTFKPSGKSGYNRKRGV